MSVSDRDRRLRHNKADAPLDRLRASWDDFGAVYHFNPNLKGSFILDNSAYTEPGAEGQCDLSDGKNDIQERIVKYAPHRRLVIDVCNSTLPLKSAVASFDLKSLGPDRAEVTMTFEFKPKFGLLGRLMVPIMKPQFRKLLGRLLDGNKAFVERSEKVRRAA